MQPGQGTTDKKDDQVSWWCKLLARGIGTVGGIVAMVLGIVRCVTIDSSCLVAGILQLTIGFSVVVLESPCCCQFLDFIDKIDKFSQNRPYWQKAAYYLVISLLPIILCFSATTMLGSAAIMATGALYGMMALGRKASRDEMLQKVKVERADDMEMKATLIDNEESVNLQVPDSPAK